MKRLQQRICLALVAAGFAALIGGCERGPTLQEAIDLGDVDEIRTAADRCADIDEYINFEQPYATRNSGNTMPGVLTGTALHQAALHAHAEAADLLLERGADIHAIGTIGGINSTGHTPLHWAVDASLTAIARSLIDHGADVNTTDGQGSTPLHQAAMTGQTEIADLLLANGAAVDARDALGWTPLIWAARLNHPTAVQLLIGNGADVGVIGLAGMQAIHHASHKGNLEVVRLLIEGGADVNAADREGNRPLSYTMAKGHTELARLLRRHGAR